MTTGNDLSTYFITRYFSIEVLNILPTNYYGQISDSNRFDRSIHRDIAGKFYQGSHERDSAVSEV